MKQAIEAQNRDWLEEQVRLWQSREIVTGAQAATILALYEPPEEGARRHASRGIFILKAVAATCVGLAVLLLVGHNWEQFSATVKMALLFSAVAGAHGTGLFLRFRRGARAPSEIAFFLGCLFYGASIFLVAQIFHLNAHMPDGVWWWALGVLPFALLLDSLLLHALLVALLATWTGMEILQAHGRGLPGPAWTLPLMALPGLLWSYRRNSSKAAALYAPLLAWWLVLQPVAWRDHSNPLFFIGAVGGMFLVLAECHRARSEFAIAYRFWGVLAAFGVIVPLGFIDVSREVFAGHAPPGLLKTGLILVPSAGLLSWAFLQSRRTAPGIRDFLRRQWLPAGLLLMMLLFSLLELAPGGMQTSGRPGMPAILTAVLSNIALVGGSLWLVGLGLREERGRPFGAGVALFLLWAVMRYIDLFGDFGGMTGAAAMFLLCGGTLYGVARYWKQRKELRHA